MNDYLNKKQTMLQRKQAMQKMFFSATFRTALIVFVAVFGFLYITKTTAMSNRGYVISKLEDKVKGLENETKKTEVEIAYLKSMKSIQERLNKINLVSSVDITYLTPVGNSVALK